VVRFSKPKIANYRGDYATHVDFCDLLINDTKQLYLLAFVLTTNHQESERCFVLTVREAFGGQAVFKDWARSWVKRRLIENAITIVCPASARNGHKRDLWSVGQLKAQRDCEIDTVTKLPDFERFVFVTLILEHDAT
jgi:hypothetical protein